MRAFTMIMALLMAFIQDTKPFTFKKDSTMTYTNTLVNDDGSVDKSTSTWAVSKVDGDKVYVDVKSDNENGTFVYSYAGGFFKWGTVKNNVEDPAMNLFKLDAKKGESWNPSPKEVKIPENTVSITYEDDEELTVPAGKFACKRLVLTAGKGLMKMTYWVSDKVGLVKATRETFGKLSAQIELQAFTEGK